MSPVGTHRGSGRPAALILTVILAILGLWAVRACARPGVAPPAPAPAHVGVRGAWLAPRQGAPLDSDHATTALRALRGLGVTTVAVGHDVTMPKLGQPELRWGDGDSTLRGVLRRIRGLGLQAFLMPRIESPDFFVPPYPFRADIDFAAAGAWDGFHDHLQRMVVHYARLAAEEGVGLFAVGLELKHSVRKFPAVWRRIIAAARAVYPGKITYSANWYDEWRDITFWDATDYIGIGAYFELPAPGAEEGRAGADGLAACWQPIVRDIDALAARVGRPVLFTEVGYTGYADCAARPWEWAGKQERGVPIDHAAQAQAYAALCRAVASCERIAGLCLWTAYTARGAEPWEYAFRDRPAEAVVRAFYGGR